MIIVDDRAGSNRYPALLRSLGLPVTLGRLEYGDFSWLGVGVDGAPITVGVEHKRLDDLLQSITSGRFAGHQLPGLVQMYDHPYLVIEGLWRPDPRSGILQTRAGKTWVDVGRGARRWMYRDIEHWLTTMEVRGGITVRRTATSEESAQLIQALYGWWQKGLDNHRSHLVLSQAHSITRANNRDAALLSKPTLVRRIANELEGIGWDRSAAVAAHFPTVLDMVLADLSEWTKIKGIGKTTATRVIASLTTRGTK